MGVPHPRPFIARIRNISPVQVNCYHLGDARLSTARGKNDNANSISIVRAKHRCLL